MDTKQFADPDCRLCHGRGRVKTGETLASWAVCFCAIAGQRKQTADMLINKLFPERAQKMTLNNYQTGGILQNEQALKISKNFVDNYSQARSEGWMIGFYGPPQSGKTHLSVGIAQAITKRYLARPLFMNLPKALKTERERYSNSDIESELIKGTQVDLLILDDLGAEYERAEDRSRVSWLTEQVYTLLDERIMKNLPTVYTTNLSPTEMETKYNNEAGQRIIARMKTALVMPPIKVMPVDEINKDDDGVRKLLLK
jgi:DNA replication protein DnaC